jgi:hypothetical protein
MKYTRDSQVTVLAKVEGMLEYIEEKTGTKVTDGMLAMAGGMSCGSAAGFVGWSDEQVNELLEFANSKEENE